MNALDLKKYLNEFPENVLSELTVKNDIIIFFEFSLNEVNKKEEMLAIIQKLRETNA